MSQLAKCLALIQGRPGMYLGAENLTVLEAFIGGYKHCLYDMDPSDSYHDSDIFRFNDWVRARFGVTDSHGWRSILEYHYGNDAYGLKQFFELWNEFLQEDNAASK